MLTLTLAVCLSAPLPRDRVQVPQPLRMVWACRPETYPCQTDTWTEELAGQTYRWRDGATVKKWGVLGPLRREARWRLAVDEGPRLLR